MEDYRANPNTGGHDTADLGGPSYDEPNTPGVAIIAAPYPDLGIQCVDIDGTSSTSGFDNGPVIQGWSDG